MSKMWLNCLNNPFCLLTCVCLVSAAYFTFCVLFCKSAVSGCTFAATSWQHQKLYLSLSGSECSALEPTSEEKMNGKHKELDVYVACPVTVLRTRVIVNFLLQHDDIVNVLVHHVFIPMQPGNEAMCWIPTVLIATGWWAKKLQTCIWC